MRTWKCKGCGREVQLEQEDIAASGVPICGNCDTRFCNEEMELVPALAARKLWLCPACGFASPAKEEAVKKHGGTCTRCSDGRPICGVFMSEPPAMPQVKLIVEMYGGAIERVFQDRPDLQVTDIIFTEHDKYLDGSHDRDKKGKLLFPVTSGPLKGQGIYSHYDDVAFGGDKMFAPVVKAAEARKAARKAGGR
jgi:hypothetical protein